MRRAVFLLFAFVPLNPVTAADVIELTKDNPETLVGTNAADYQFFGLRLGMTEDEVWPILRELSGMTAEKSASFAFVQVYDAAPDSGGRKKTLFALRWDDDPGLNAITFREPGLLAPNFKQVFDDGLAESPSKFMKEFLGESTGQKVDNRGARGGVFARTTLYERIGVSIIRVKSRSGTIVSLSFSKATKVPEKESGIREWADNTGQYRIRAILVKVENGNATLRKKTTSRSWYQFHG